MNSVCPLLLHLLTMDHWLPMVQLNIPGTKRIYGTRGNSFVAVVEFGEKVVARSSLAGGVSGDPNSPYFMNQALDYTLGKFKDVQFYKEDLLKAYTRMYKPGQ
jgi:acyl-homoserine-lactone acylase